MIFEGFLKNFDMKNLLTILALIISTLTLSAQKINTIPYTEEVLPAEKLSSNINSIYAERLPIITPDGRTLYFARKYHPGNTPDERERDTYEIYKDDIWVSRRQAGGDWSKARNVGPPLNTDTHNFVVAVSADGKTVYLANKYKTQKDGVSYSTKTGFGWSKPKAFKIPNMYNRSKFVGYHVNVKGDVLIMAVERSKTVGGRDLYVSFRKKGDDWTEPKNMGKVINSKSEEASVFIAADNKTIYFSSMGHPGYGGYDVFMSRRLDDTWTKWSEPLNLGERINTPGNDYNYTIPASGEYAYFSSDVGEQSLMSNLYKIELPKEVRPKPVTVINFTMKKLPKPDPIHMNITMKKKEKPIHMNITMKKEEIEEEEPVELNITLKRKPRDIESTTAVRPNEAKEIDKRDNSKELAPTPEIEEQVVVIIDEETEDELPEIPGYFTVRETPKAEVVYEEIDYDGNDPEIIEEIKIPNKVKRMKRRDSKKDSPELETLKQKLLSLEYEIEEIAEVRDDENLTDLPEKVTIKYRRKIEEDPRMLLLKRKYAGMHKTVDEIEEDPRTALMKNKFKNLYYEDEEDEKEKIMAEIRAERERKKEREQERERERESQIVAEPDPQPEKPKFTYKPNRASDDEIANVVEGDDEMTETPSFEELQAEVREDVERDLIEEVRLELQQEMVSEVRSELENELSREVRSKLETDLRDDIEQQLRNELQESVAQRLEDDLEENVKDDLRSEMRDDIEKELREAMRDDIEKTLREQLANELKDELREELSYRYKREIEAQLRREITQKVRKEAKERERDIALNSPEATAPKKYRELEENVTLYPIEVGQIIPLNNIYFDANEATLKQESEDELLRTLKFLDKNPSLIVEISGHTNGLCSTEFANELSSARSATVANFLKENGISKARVTNKGYGKIQPIASNANVEGRRKNQRVEMKILEIE